MNVGHFYFLCDDYFKDFPDPYLEKNKETINGVLHGRPCFFSFMDNSTQIYWMIPFSSQVSKFKSIYQDKVTRTKKCDTIVFGDVLGHEKAFLIQNMCPAIPKYISSEYIDKISSVPVKVDRELEIEIIQKSKKYWL